MGKYTSVRYDLIILLCPIPLRFAEGVLLFIDKDT